MTVDVAKRCAAPLADLGFRKRAGGIFTTDLDDEVFGWLGLNRASRHRPAGEVEVNPVVGVRHQGVERLVAEYCGQKFHPYVPATVVTPLSHLMPDGRYRTWVFGASNDDDASGREMVAAIEKYGLPFMRATVTLPELSRRIEDGFGIDSQLDYRRPVALLLAGDRAGARRALEAALTRLGDRGDPAAQDLRRFVDALSVRIAEQS